MESPAPAPAFSPYPSRSFIWPSIFCCDLGGIHYELFKKYTSLYKRTWGTRIIPCTALGSEIGASPFGFQRSDALSPVGRQHMFSVKSIPHQTFALGSAILYFW